MKPKQTSHIYMESVNSVSVRHIIHFSANYGHISSYVYACVVSHIEMMHKTQKFKFTPEVRYILVNSKLLNRINGKTQLKLSLQKTSMIHFLIQCLHLTISVFLSVICAL